MSCPVFTLQHRKLKFHQLEDLNIIDNVGTNSAKQIHYGHKIIPDIAQSIVETGALLEAVALCRKSVTPHRET